MFGVFCIKNKKLQQLTTLPEEEMFDAEEDEDQELDRYAAQFKVSISTIIRIVLTPSRDFVKLAYH